HVLLVSDIPERFYEGKEQLRVIVNGFNYEGSFKKVSCMDDESSTYFYVLGLSKEIRKRIGKEVGQHAEIRVLFGEKKIYSIL
ncbi:MAG: hypothetical protein ACLTXM_08220, partial [Enterococcus sp.]